MEVAPRSIPTSLFRAPGWLTFCLAILLLKMFLFALDPTPQMFMGDSGSYLWTAVSGWIPSDRSFLYGFVVRWLALSTHSLTTLLIFQTVISALTALLVPYICRSHFHLSSRISYLAGFLCAVDPLQLVWERYVMTETISLATYAFMLLFSLRYLRQRKLWQILLIQILAVLLISFRISYLLVVQASTVCLPLIAFFPLALAAFRKAHATPDRAFVVKHLALHLLLSLALMLGLHFAYKSLNGALTKRSPAYLYSSGFSVLATWAPTLRPADAADPRLADLIAHGSEMNLTDMHSRNSQLYAKDALLDRWKQTEPNLSRADQIAKQTALHALTHHPMDIFSLGARTFLDYFDFRQIRKQAKSDLDLAGWPNPMTATMADRFRLAPPAPREARNLTISQRYFVKAQPYYYVALLSPFFCAALFFFLHEGFVVLFFLHGCILLATDSFLAVTASVRYLQPLSFLTVFILALFIQQASIRLSPCGRAHPSI